MNDVHVSAIVNGDLVHRTVPARRLLSDFLRDDLGLTGTHVGCEHGVCGSCNVLVDDEPVRSCLMLAAQADGRSICTVEGLTSADGSLHVVQRALIEERGFQCGFCTPGVALALVDLIERGLPKDDDQLREELAGNICRCTGYVGIVRAARRAAELM